MIERVLLSQKIKEFQVQEYVVKNLKRVGHSGTKLQRTPLGEKIVISASRPGLVVGIKGQNIKKLTAVLKKGFDLENPQIEINEVQDVDLNAKIVAERITNSLEKFGLNRFKGVGHKAMENVMRAGALGVEIIISGKVPSSRAKNWRFYSGYLKKCGDIAISGVDKAYSVANLKSGTVGIKVKIMPATTKLPDDIKVLPDEPEVETGVEETEESAGKDEEATDAPEKKIEEKEEKKAPKKESKKDAPKKSKKNSDSEDVKTAEDEK